MYTTCIILIFINYTYPYLAMKYSAKEQLLILPISSLETVFGTHSIIPPKNFY